MHWLAKTLKKLLASPQASSAGRSRRAKRSRLELEGLEERSLLATISGVAFVGANATGSPDALETRLPGVQLALAGSTSSGVPLNVTTTTNANGAYSFTNVFAGTYQLGSGRLSAFSGGAATIGSFTVGDGDSLTENFSFGGLTASSISLRQFLTNSTS